MRVNSKELAHLAQQKNGHFDKEGLLQIKEKQEGLFRKGEVFVERYCKLRGNLLFYHRTKDSSSEAVGLLLLERCVVELDPDEQLNFSFILVFEGDDKVIYFGATSEQQRDSWIEHLHIASYECMKMQMECLRDQIRLKTGHDPIDNPQPSTLSSIHQDDEYTLSEPFLEMCISCDSLPMCLNGREPNTYASVHYITPYNQQWVVHGHTEVVERCCNPIYLTTVGFNNPHIVTMDTRVRVTIYDVKERMTNTMTQLGSVQVTISDLLTATEGRHKLRLHSYEMQDVGSVTMMAWQNENYFETLNGKSREVLKSSNAKRMDMLRPLYDNIDTKTFRFPTNCGNELSVHEYMAESKLTFYLPRQLLKLWVEEEKQKIEQLTELGELPYQLSQHRQRYLASSADEMSTYTIANKTCLSNEGAPFKPSVKKGHKEVEFAPTNLHLQRVWVHNDTKQISSCYDMMTSGAFTAYAQKYKHGGLRKLIRHLQSQLTSESTNGIPENKMAGVNKIQNDMTTLCDAVNHYCEEVCRAAMQAAAADLGNFMAAVADKTRQLVGVCENPLLAECVEQYSESQEDQDTPQQPVRPQSHQYLTTDYSGPQRASSPDRPWKWSGTDFIKSPTVEPWDLTRLNTEAALVCVVSKVEEVVGGGGSSGKWLEDLSPLVIKLKQCVQVMCGRARSGLTFLMIRECGHQVALMHTIKYRRDVVFSQAMTTAVSAFITKLRSSATDEIFLRQIFQIGVLMQFDSYLSCHGDEVGMIEDMAVGVSDLAHIVFRVKEATGPDDILPKVSGNNVYRDGPYPDYNRTGYVVDVPVPSALFQLLPRELQKGRSMKIVPVLFNVGINEQATLAEKFGDTSLQESINAESYKQLYLYYEKYVEIIGEPECAGRHALPMEQLMRHLHINVMSKKNKNVEILHLASEVCRKLGGIRFIHCKSGKDRTSMGATLEQVQLLQRDHDLAAHIFLQALDCMRSEGVRRENTQKNTGTRKYAFNSLQLLAFPKLYKPPSGTYGNTET